MRGSSVHKRARDDDNEDDDGDDTITLVSGDGRRVEVKRFFAMLLGTVANLLQDVKDQREILLPAGIRGTTLRLICDALERVTHSSRLFVLLHDKTQSECIEILLAANYLDAQMQLHSAYTQRPECTVEVVCEKVLGFNQGRWWGMNAPPLGPGDVLPMDKDPGTTTFTLDQVATLDHVPRALLIKYMFCRMSWNVLCAARLDSVSMAYAVQRYMEQKARAVFPKLAATATTETLLHCFIDLNQAHDSEMLQKTAAQRLYALKDKDLTDLKRDPKKGYQKCEVAEVAFIKYKTWEALLTAREQSIARDKAAKERLEKARLEKRQRTSDNRRHLRALLLTEHGYSKNALATVYKHSSPEWCAVYNRWLAGSQEDITPYHAIYAEIVGSLEIRIRNYAHRREFIRMDELVTPTKFAEIVASDMVAK